MSTLLPYQERVRTEQQELAVKLAQLANFIQHAPAFRELPEDEQNRLAQQAHYMHQYDNVLKARILAFAGTPLEDLPTEEPSPAPSPQATLEMREQAMNYAIHTPNAADHTDVLRAAKAYLAFLNGTLKETTHD
jgi:hypothetical protein